MDTLKLNLTSLEQQLFVFLSINAGKEFSQRDIAKQLNVSPTAIGNVVKTLLPYKFITLNSMKTINLISFNRDNQKAIDLKRCENLRQIYLSNIVDYLEEKLAGSTIILFGSYAKGEDTITSDIDISVIGRKTKALNLNIFEKVLQRVINIHFYDSFKDIDKNLKNNILNGIVLVGSVDV